MEIIHTILRPKLNNFLRTAQKVDFFVNSFFLQFLIRNFKDKNKKMKIGNGIFSQW